MPRFRLSIDRSKTSSIFTYWRHEFHSYSLAHAPGGSHEVSADGFHPDGTLHVDHDSLIIAIQGLVLDDKHPDDPSKAKALVPGSHITDVAWASLESSMPVDPGAMKALVDVSIALTAAELEEEDDD